MVRIDPMRVVRQEVMDKTLTVCPWCNDGIFRPEIDGKDRCGNCGAEETYDTPQEKSQTMKCDNPRCENGFVPSLRNDGSYVRCPFDGYKDTPLVLGGQGKDGEETISSGLSWGWIVGVMFLCLGAGMFLGMILG